MYVLPVSFLFFVTLNDAVYRPPLPRVRRCRPLPPFYASQLIVNGLLVANSIVQIKEYICNTITGRR